MIGSTCCIPAAIWAIWALIRAIIKTGPIRLGHTPSSGSTVSSFPEIDSGGPTNRLILCHSVWIV
jgi:hypothetical protein